MTDTIVQNDKLVPEGIPGWQMPFWEGLREGEVRVQQCAQCGTLRHVPKEICHVCYSTEWTWTAISGKGAIYTYTTVLRAPTPAYQEEAPYVIVHVTMDEGVRMVGRLIDADPATIAVGDAVTAAVQPLNDQWSALDFRLVEK